MAGPAPTITVVVSSLNGASTIGACLEALDRQSVREVAQVVVVDDGSSDGTADIARSYDVEVVVHGRNLGLSAARNTGVERARAPIVAFTDDDCVPDAGWLAALVEAHDRPGVIGVGGPVEVAHVKTLIHRYLEEHPPLAPLELDLEQHQSLAGRFGLYLERMWRPDRNLRPRAVYSFPGANMSFKRWALQAVGGFNPRLKFGSEDEYMCGRIREHFPSPALWFEPRALVRHDYVGTLADLTRRSFAYGRGQAQVYLGEDDRRWPIIFPFPVALVVSMLAWRRSRRIALVPLGMNLLYPQGLLGVIRHRRPADLAYSWFRLAEESAHNLGMLSGLLDLRRGQAEPS